jgi:salicylate hydroxylase
MSQHALISGAGVGGITAALALARRGWRVTLLERSRLTDDVGAGLQISPNASAILRKYDVLPRLGASALAPSAIHIRRGRDGATIARLPLENAERRWGAPYLLAHRGDLQRALLETVAGEPAIAIERECFLSDIAATARDVTATALQGATSASYTADCLVGADGLRSLARERLNAGKQDDMPRSARYVAWRALVKSDGLPLGLRQPESTIWLGAGAHIVHYPLRGGRITNVVAVLHETKAISAAGDIWAELGEPRQIAARFARWDRSLRELIAAANEWRIWPLIERAPPPVWTEGRVALIGDAAHPILPFLAQGAAQAIEDAAALASFLEPGREIAAALAKFAAARRSRIERVQRQSRRQAGIYHLAAVPAFFRDLVIRSLGQERVIARYDWLYGGKPIANAKENRGFA